MAIVTEISWDDMWSGKALPESPARKAFREAVAEIAENSKAPSNWCKHRIAAGLAKRAYPLAKSILEQSQVQPETIIPSVVDPIESETVKSTVELPNQSEPAVSPVAHTHSEAPASCNTYIDIAGRKVQLTLRDDNEENLLSRIEKLLSRFPMPEQET